MIKPTEQQRASNAPSKFQTQKCAAAKRGIQWDLTFEQWWDWWQASGHWDERGKMGHNYVMARYGDRGPYTVSNIYCSTVADNISQAQSRKAGKPKKGIAVCTPLGTFQSATAAAECHNMTVMTVLTWAKKNRHGFSVASKG